MIYDANNATFITMMYQSQTPLKQGEIHCYYCNGYGIKPILKKRGEKTQRR